MSGDFEMSYHAIRIAGKKIETYDDFEYEKLSTNKDFFEEIFHKYKEPTKEMIQDIVGKICPEKSVFDNGDSRFSMLALYSFQQRFFLYLFTKVFEYEYDLITFCDLWNKYAKQIALDNNRFCFAELKVSRTYNENLEIIGY